MPTALCRSEKKTRALARQRRRIQEPIAEGTAGRKAADEEVTAGDPTVAVRILHAGHVVGRLAHAYGPAILKHLTRDDLRGAGQVAVGHVEADGRGGVGHVVGIQVGGIGDDEAPGGVVVGASFSLQFLGEGGEILRPGTAWQEVEGEQKQDSAKIGKKGRTEGRGKPELGMVT